MRRDMSQTTLNTDQYIMYRVIEKRPNITLQELQIIFTSARGTIHDRITFLKIHGLIKDKVINKHGQKGYSIIKKKRVWK